uniref:Uncharacterized protein n=1 Tax=Timema cristinae TaxID=61476 RepID=A0A7R9H9L4_TIMCR|nr:unnamed protein product [Timema cristinae]
MFHARPSQPAVRLVIAGLIEENGLPWTPTLGSRQLALATLIWVTNHLLHLIWCGSDSLTSTLLSYLLQRLSTLGTKAVPSVDSAPGTTLVHPCSLIPSILPTCRGACWTAAFEVWVLLTVVHASFLPATLLVYSWHRGGTLRSYHTWCYPGTHHLGTPLLAHSLDRACMPRSLLDCIRLECMGLEAGHLPCLQSLRPDIEGIIRYVDCCPREYGAERSLHNPSTMNAERVYMFYTICTPAKECVPRTEGILAVHLVLKNKLFQVLVCAFHCIKHTLPHLNDHVAGILKLFHASHGRFIARIHGLVAAVFDRGGPVGITERAPVPLTAPEQEDGGGISSFNNTVYTLS